MPELAHDQPEGEPFPTINPYRYAALEIKNRLRWDLRPESWRSRRLLRQNRDRHTGGAAVIVCNGPSLNQTNLGLLEGYYTFGLNKINLLFERSQFRPSCIVSVNTFVIEQNQEFFNTTELPLFLDSKGRDVVRPRPNVAFLHASSQRKFARDCSFSIHQGFTVTYVAMQLAFHMGFRHLALIGCDHSFAVKGVANRVVTAQGKDESHFDPRYFAGGVQWQLPDLSGSETSYAMAHEAFHSAGGTLTNCTVGGNLEVLPRQSLDTWVAAHRRD